MRSGKLSLALLLSCIGYGTAFGAEEIFEFSAADGRRFELRVDVLETEDTLEEISIQSLTEMGSTTSYPLYVNLEYNDIANFGRIVKEICETMGFHGSLGFGWEDPTMVEPNAVGYDWQVGADLHLVSASATQYYTEQNGRIALETVLCSQ